MSDASLKWQPVVLILEGGQRVECECGALAVFISGKRPKDRQEDILDNAECWCQDCWVKAVDEQEQEA